MSVCQIKSVLLDENVVQRHMIMKPANSYVWSPYRKVRGIYNSFSVKREFLVAVNPFESDRLACEFFWSSHIYILWSRSEKAVVVATVRASFQVMASAGSLRASSPIGGVARSHAKGDSVLWRLASLQASSPFMAGKLSHKRTPHALVALFTCGSCVTCRDSTKWRACSQATARFARHNLRTCSQTSDHRNPFTPIYEKIKRNCRSKF